MIIPITLSCKKNVELSKTISTFAAKKERQLLADSTEKINFIQVTFEKNKTDLENLKLNGNVAMLCEVFYGVYLVGKTYFKVNTFGMNWDPNDIDSIYFNKVGFVVKTVFVHAANNFTHTTFYNYDTKNRLISSTIFNPKKFIISVAKNHIFEPQSDPYFRKDTIITIFNDEGYLSEKRIVDLVTDTVKSIINFVYHFDENKNWTKCIMYQNKIPIGITERTIEYYN